MTRAVSIALAVLWVPFATAVLVVLCGVVHVIAAIGYPLRRRRGA